MERELKTSEKIIAIIIIILIGDLIIENAIERVKPIEISTIAELQQFAKKVNAGNTYKDKTISLTADLDLSPICGKNINGKDSSWIPIGNGHAFEGNFNGNGHVISNLYINAKDNNLSDFGLFGYNKGEIKNLGVSVNYTIGDRKYSESMGGLCGFNSGTITLCYSSGSITCKNEIDCSIGGLCGYNKGTISECYNVTNISGISKYLQKISIGGLCGCNENEITNCYNTGSVNGGGICGLYKTGKISKCYNIGNINGYNETCNIYSHKENDSLTNCFYDNQVCLNQNIASKDSSVKSKLTAELTNGSFFNDPKIWIEEKGMYPRLKGLENTNIAIANALPVCLPEKVVFSNVTSQFKVGTKNNITWTATPTNSLSIDNETGNVRITSGKTEIVTLSATCKDTIYKTLQIYINHNKALSVDNTDDLINLQKGINSGEIFIYKGNTLAANGRYATFMLTTDIDFSSVHEDNINGKDSCWMPIGNNSYPFEGTFDGNGHVISGLYINKKEKGIHGLFGCNCGEIKNLGMINGYIKGGNISGSICGKNSGKISNCYNKNNVTGDFYAGGICGANRNGGIINCYNTGCITGNIAGGITGDFMNYKQVKYYHADSSYNKIINCYNIGKINGVSRAAGICIIRGSAKISNCLNSGDITGDTSSIIGGICTIEPYGEVNVLNCWNSGNITGNIGSCVGGICGNGNNVKNCYNTGNVSVIVNKESNLKKYSSSCAGGICGNLHKGSSISNCYNIGKISGYKKIGGICGAASGKGTKNIINCYNAGYIEGSEKKGSICGIKESKNLILSHCYYNKEKCIISGIRGINERHEAGIVEGKSTSELQTGALFNDPENWIEEKGKYPQLKNVGVQE